MGIFGGAIILPATDARSICVARPAVVQGWRPATHALTLRENRLPRQWPREKPQQPLTLERHEHVDWVKVMTAHMLLYLE